MGRYIRSRVYRPASASKNSFIPHLVSSVSWALTVSERLVLEDLAAWKGRLGAPPDIAGVDLILIHELSPGVVEELAYHRNNDRAFWESITWHEPRLDMRIGRVAEWAVSDSVVTAIRGLIRKGVIELWEEKHPGNRLWTKRVESRRAMYFVLHPEQDVMARWLADPGNGKDANGALWVIGPSRTFLTQQQMSEWRIDDSEQQRQLRRASPCAGPQPQERADGAHG